MRWEGPTTLVGGINGAERPCREEGPTAQIGVEGLGRAAQGHMDERVPGARRLRAGWASSKASPTC